jgi:hypothetical protein
VTAIGRGTRLAGLRLVRRSDAIGPEALETGGAPRSCRTTAADLYMPLAVPSPKASLLTERKGQAMLGRAKRRKTPCQLPLSALARSQVAPENR